MFSFFKSKNKSSNPLEITDANFSELIYNSEIPVVLDFYATWCQPCQVMISLINRLAREDDLQDKVKIAKVDIDANPQLAQHFNIRSVPTLLFIQQNTIRERHNGLLPYIYFKEKTEQLVQL